MRIAAYTLATLILVALFIVALKPTPASIAPQTVPPASPALAPASQPPVAQLALLNTPDAQQAVAAIEQMIKPLHAGILSSPEEHGRFICVLVEGDERFFTLDMDVAESDLPFLKQYGFANAPSPLDRTTSRYKSVAKSTLHYDQAAGDRMIVLICPRAQWANLNIQRPALQIPPLSTPSQGAQKRSDF